ncbi:MAG: TIGR01177 family methyltransferase [Candidatus Hydrothermarchaeota archaeon]
MRLLFHLSGEHPTLPRAEVLAVLEASGISYSVLESMDQALIVEADSVPDIGRLALSHRVCELLLSCEVSEVPYRMQDLNVGTSSFAVRGRRIKGHARSTDVPQLERAIGASIKARGGRVDLRSPEVTYYGILTERFLLGRVLAEMDRAQYQGRRPHRRPYFHPGAMLPRNSRCLVNLTRVKPGDRFLDPFCGTGGFLIEAGLLGAKLHGCDIDPEAVEGCRRNLEAYGVKDYTVEERDARSLGSLYPGTFDAVATDPPYGVSASTGGLGLEELYGSVMGPIRDVLKPGGYACVVAPDAIPLEGLAAEAGFKVVEVHLDRIHGSLTRKIVVGRK